VSVTAISSAASLRLAVSGIGLQRSARLVIFDVACLRAPRGRKAQSALVAGEHHAQTTADEEMRPGERAFDKERN
jgi:hypothetical protein